MFIEYLLAWEKLCSYWEMETEKQGEKWLEFL